MKEKIIFESENGRTIETSILKKIIIPNFLLVIIFAIFMFAIVRFDFKENPLFFIIPIILIIQILISKLLKLNSKKVYYLEFNNNNIFVKYKRGNSDQNITLPIFSTEINLIELKDHRSFFNGIQINLLNKNAREKLKLLDGDWNYVTFEKIYLEFKERKNERIPENEKRVFEQLQIMNGAKKNDG